MPELIMARGNGVALADLEGREYIDGLASLWNVNVGYGRTELADAAADQMKRLAFSSAYGGFSTAPGIELAAKLAELAPGDLEVTFFASGGAEANDTAYKLARLYWQLRGEPERVNIVSRLRDYHGLTYGATSATGLANFWKGFGPLAPGFLHAPPPDPYRFSGEGSAGAAYAKALKGAMWHAFTYSGHPTACAVALRNLRILEEEHLVERAAEKGAYLQKRLQDLRSHEIVGDVRGLGLIGGVELVRNRGTKESFEDRKSTRLNSSHT